MPPERSSAPRPGTARVRLTRALATLTAQAPAPSRVTVAQLCRLANVSRNSLYRYHTPILATLRQHQGRKSARARAQRSVTRNRSENALLRERLAKLATLVDHYFTAYRQSVALLARREHELAELRREAASRPAMLPASGQRAPRRDRTPEEKGPNASVRPGPT